MTERGTIDEYVQALLASSRMSGEVVYHGEQPRRKAKTATPAVAPDSVTGRILSWLGVDALYTHQAEGLAHVRAGRHIVVATPTASGKTLIYNLPVVERVLARPEARALYVFPLKALAQDQWRVLSDMTAALGARDRVSAAIYDGDTTGWQRRKIRENPPAVIMTNPEMIHLALLPYHSAWQDFFANLEIVVIDEVHTYRGVLGSHMAQVLARFRRICRHYGADPVFVASSATIANPGELTGALTGAEAVVVSESGAPGGRRHVILVNPAAGPASAAILLLKAALHRRLRTIVYAQSRKLTELISLWVERSGKYAAVVSSYRAGLLPEERREVERKLASGELLAVVSTSALELGIDIGDLDLCILVGYPGSVMATWQRGGRVGRGGQDSALILVAGEDALDQYFMRHPAEFISRPPEAAVINPDNRVIAEKHLLCAAAELPLRADDSFLAGRGMRQAVSSLTGTGRLLRSADGVFLFSSRKSPHREVDLRGVGRNFQIVCEETGDDIGSVDGVRAFRDTHPGAVYLHLGRTYVVRDLDIEARCATVRPRAVKYYTRVRSEKDTEILEVFEERHQAGFSVFSGRLRVTERITGYEKWTLYARKRLNIISLSLPPLVFETEGVWFVIPWAVREAAENSQRHFMGGIHAVEHAVIGVLPLFVMCDRNDLGGISIPYHPQAGGPAVFVYDAIPGGVGLSRQAFARAGELLVFTRKMIEACPCETGCPSCVHSPKCGSGNRPIDKGCAVFILRKMLPSKSAAAAPRKKSVIPEPSVPAAVNGSKLRADGVRYGVFDVETQQSAAEVGGWNRADRMRVSCVVLYDSATDSYHEFLEEQMPEFFDHLKRLELVVGFNNKRFDNRVISAYSDFELASLPTLDILEEVHRVLGYRLSLDNLVSETLGARKSADGMQALIWWKQGRIDEIVRYCRKDVELTKNLYLFGRANGYLLFRNKAGTAVRVPVGW